jgi:hypothetical protein
MKRLMAILVCVTDISFAGTSQIYGPFLASNPERIQLFGGHCKSRHDERMLWSAINKFSKSFLKVVPAIPPEQLKYIKGELESGNINRQMNIMRSSMYAMKNFYESLESAERLSAQVIEAQEGLSLRKKVEFTGRVLASIVPGRLDGWEMGALTSDLRSKGYLISEADLDFARVTALGLSRSLVSYLICFGEGAP